MNKTTILLPGGDLRYGYTARALSDAYDVHTDDDLPQYDVLLLPIAAEPDPALAGKVKPGGTVLYGSLPAPPFPGSGLMAIDYMKNEELAVRNAVPTAEGAVQILLEEMPVTVFGSRVLVLGFGRIGSRMAALLHALGAKVTVAARDAATRARAEMTGCRSIDFKQLPAAAPEADVICNTVPAVVVDAAVLQAMRPEAFVLDLASKPGGVDWEAAQALGCKVVWALSLPGKTAPVTAGESIAVTVRHILEERGAGA